MSQQRTLQALFQLPRGMAIVALLLALAGLTIFFLIDDILYYLLIERIFDVHMGGFAKALVGVLFLVLNFGVALLVIRAMLRRPETGTEAMVGARGEVMESIQPPRQGWVRIHGELWRATAAESTAKGESVEVVAVDGLLLRVKAIQKP